MSERDWRDEPLLPDQTDDDVDHDDAATERDRDDELRDDVPPHHGPY